MKKIVRLSESDLVKLVKKVINENKFENQSDVDKVLDKINKFGMESLTADEREFLQNPDDSDFEFEGSEGLHEILSKLIKDKLIDPDYVTVYENGFELYKSFEEESCFYDSYDFIKFNLLEDEEGNAMLIIDSEIFPNENEDERQCRYDYYSHIIEVWGEHDIMVDCDDLDYLEYSTSHHFEFDDEQDDDDEYLDDEDEENK